MNQRLTSDTIADFHSNKQIKNVYAHFVNGCNWRLNTVSHRICKTLGRFSCPEYETESLIFKKGNKFEFGGIDKTAVTEFYLWADEQRHE
jgi:hypothetical protein